MVPVFLGMIVNVFLIVGIVMSIYRVKYRDPVLVYPLPNRISNPWVGYYGRYQISTILIRRRNYHFNEQGDDDRPPPLPKPHHRYRTFLVPSWKSYYSDNVRSRRKSYKSNERFITVTTYDCFCDRSIVTDVVERDCCCCCCRRRRL